MDAFHKMNIKCSQFLGLTLINEMFTKVIFFALLAVAIAKRPRIGLRMPPLFPLSPQIVGGEEAPVGGYPFIVSLQAKGIHFCAGSILNENWILTAGHCAHATSVNLITVRAGKHYVLQNEDSEQAVQVEKFIVHEKYQGGVGPYDIAVLKLASPLMLNERVQSIELAPPKSEPKGVAWLCGWGSVGAIFLDMPEKLQHVKLEYIDFNTCSDALKRLVGSSSVHETNICTGPMYNQISACSGDSGGPLISHNGQKAIQTGIVSWGIMPCGTPGAPSVFTKVSEYNDWIAQNTANY